MSISKKLVRNLCITGLALSGIIGGSSALFYQKPVNAQQSLTFYTDKIGSGGNGCPKGTFMAIPFGNEISFIFNEFQAVAQPGQSAINASCNLRIPVLVPRGYTIQEITVVSTGFADIPTGGSGAIDTKLTAGTYTLGSKSSQFPGGFSATYQLTTDAGAQTFNACSNARPAILGLSTNLIARALNAKQPTTVNLSTQDVRSEGKLQILFNAVPCR